MFAARRFFEAYREYVEKKQQRGGREAVRCIQKLRVARALVSTVTPPQTFLNSIQIGRALAAMAVALQHTIKDADRYYPRYSESNPTFAYDSSSWVELLGAGVDVFFVISGIVMVISSWNAQASIGQFLYRRITRIYPLYWLLTLIFMSVLVVAPQLFGQMTLEPVHATCSLLLIPCEDPTGQAIPYIYAGWTLTYELVFYALFAVSLLVSRRCPRLIVCIGLVLIYHSLYYSPLVEIPAIANSASPIMLEFIYGLLLGYAYFIVPFSRRWAWPLLIAGTALMLVSHTGDLVLWPRFVRWGLPALLIVAGLMCLNRDTQDQSFLYKTLVYLGAISYSLYLFHFFSLKLFYVVAGKLGLLALVPPTLGVIFAFLTTVVASILVYECIEKRLTRMSKVLWKKHLANSQSSNGP